MSMYSVFDTHRPILGDETIIEANTAKEAAIKYLKPQGKQQVYRSDSGNIVITKFIERNGMKYQRGNKLVFGLITVL